MNTLEGDVNWMNERVESVPHANWLYKLCCFLLFKPKKKLTYFELFVLIYGINKKTLGDKKARQFAMAQMLVVYKFHNNKLPKTMKENDE
jgi:hypothetical protein